MQDIPDWEMIVSDKVVRKDCQLYYDHDVSKAVYRNMFANPIVYACYSHCLNPKGAVQINLQSVPLDRAKSTNRVCHSATYR